MKMKTAKTTETIVLRSVSIGLCWMFLWGLGISPLAAAGSGELSLPRERFAGANRLYEDGKYAGALRIYREIEADGSHWKLFYNIGNCYFKLNRLVPAKIYYLKAQRYHPFENSIRNNIDIVNKHLNDKNPYPKPDFVSRVLLRIESIISLNVLSIILLVFIFIFNGFVFMWIKKGKTRPIIYGVFFSLFLLLLAGTYHIYRVGKYNRGNIAVITKGNSQLRSGPGENNTVLFKVNPGLQVKIIDRSRSWLQVTASSDIAGWIEAENLERI
jgi:tetratricopeptide (TPR) repeat protein